MSKKIVLKVQLNCEKCKRKAMKTAAGTEGVESVQIDSKENKITVIGDADPVSLAEKLKKVGWTELLSVGPAKEPPKQAEKKDDKKDGGGGKKDEKKDEKKDGKKDEKKDGKKDEKKNPGPEITYVYYPYPYGGYPYYGCC